MNPLRTFAKTAPRSVTIFELKFFQPLSSYSVLMKERFHYLDRSPSDNNKSWSKNTPSRSTSLPRTKRTATL
ncbi:14209_t:CDS:1, partial [Acaulospora morrowiae]